jgi:glutamyl-tRNA synthetase
VPAEGNLIRFRVPAEGQTAVQDLIRGTVTVSTATIEDFGLRKSNGDPLFYLANTVDDATMRITHVVRGEEHLSNTPKYVLLWDALGFGPPPVFAHLPLILNERRQKLSKRHDKVAVEDYRDEGYLPEAFVNYLALLGWSPGEDREIITRQEMIAEFRLEDVKSAGAIFDERKLQSINAEYIRALPPGEFVARSQDWMVDRWQRLGPLVQERVRTLGEVYTLTDFLYRRDPVIDEADWNKAVRKTAAFGAILAAAIERYATVEWNTEEIHAATLAAGGDAGLDRPGGAQAPIRLAVMGRSAGLPLFESLELLGRDKTIARLRAGLDRLQARPPTV